MDSFNGSDLADIHGYQSLPLVDKPPHIQQHPVGQPNPHMSQGPGVDQRIENHAQEQKGGSDLVDLLMAVSSRLPLKWIAAATLGAVAIGIGVPILVLLAPHIGIAAGGLALFGFCATLLIVGAGAITFGAGAAGTIIGLVEGSSQSSQPDTQLLPSPPPRPQNTPPLPPPGPPLPVLRQNPDNERINQDQNINKIEDEDDSSQNTIKIEEDIINIQENTVPIQHQHLPGNTQQQSLSQSAPPPINDLHQQQLQQQAQQIIYQQELIQDLYRQQQRLMEQQHRFLEEMRQAQFSAKPIDIDEAKKVEEVHEVAQEILEQEKEDDPLNVAEVARNVVKTVAKPEVKKEEWKVPSSARLGKN